MKLSPMDALISALMKRGVVYEARNVKIDVDIPIKGEYQETTLPVRFTCDHMQIQLRKDD